MAVRNIVKIDESKCDGCGQCVTACAEGAIQIIDGKAKLVSEVYCDGLGACLGHCPQDAITIEQREAAEFDEQATEKHLAELESKKSSPPKPGGFACPGMMMREFGGDDSDEQPAAGDVSSQLGQWPVQLKLVSPNASYFQDCDLLLVADCVPFAMGDFHSRYLKGSSIAIGCPKLDDAGFYVEKLAEILKANRIKSLKVLHMEVPCCSGLVYVAKKAIELAGVDLDYEDITVSLRGKDTSSADVGIKSG